MVAYVVFTREKMRDEHQFNLYRGMVSGAPSNAKVLAAHGALHVVEGAAIETAVIMEFPTLAEAEAWYHSPMYQEASQHRFKGSDHRVFILQGF